MGVEDLVATVRTRSDRTGLRVPPAYRERVLAALCQRYGISSDGEHNLVVHVPRFDPLPLEGRARLPVAAVAMDLATSPEVRTRRAGADLLVARLAAISR